MGAGVSAVNLIRHGAWSRIESTNEKIENSVGFFFATDRSMVVFFIESRLRLISGLPLKDLIRKSVIVA